MLMGIIVLIASLLAMGVFVGLRVLGHWHHRLLPVLAGLGLLAIGGALQASLAPSAAESPTPTTAASSASSSARRFAGKLSIDGKHYQARFADDNRVELLFTFKAGDKFTVIDDSEQNENRSQSFDVPTDRNFWFTATEAPAVLKIRIDHRTTYQTATITIDPDPDYASKASSAAVASSKAAAASQSKAAAVAASASKADAESASRAEAEAASESRAAAASEAAASSKAAAEAASEAAAAAQAERDEYNTGITYDQLARDPDNYRYDLLHLTGKVVQVLEASGENDLRVAIDGDYDNIVLVTYPPSLMKTRVLENDKITFYGMSMGTVDYQSTLGATITVPEVFADKIEDAGRAPDNYGY